MIKIVNLNMAPAKPRNLVQPCAGPVGGWHKVPWHKVPRHKVAGTRFLPQGCFPMVAFIGVIWFSYCLSQFSLCFNVLRRCCIDGAGIEPQERSCAELDGSCANLMKEEELLPKLGELFVFLMLFR